MALGAPEGHNLVPGCEQASRPRSLPVKEVHEQEDLRVLHKLGATRGDARAASWEPPTAGALAALASD